MIIGRDTELGRVRRLLDRGAAGPAALLVEGVAGIGKSAILSAAVDEARCRDWTVLCCGPGRGEGGYAYAGLADLLPSLPAIPLVQRQALEVVTHRAAGVADPHVVAVGLVSVLRALAVQRPVLVVVDDLQWLDPETDAALDFAVRRLAGARVAVLVARRADRPGAPPWELDRLVPGVAGELDRSVPTAPRELDRPVLATGVELDRPVPKVPDGLDRPVPAQTKEGHRSAPGSGSELDRPVPAAADELDRPVLAQAKERLRSAPGPGSELDRLVPRVPDGLDGPVPGSVELGRAVLARVWLDGLSRDELHDVVYRRLGRGLARPVFDRLHALCQGNPLVGVVMAGALSGREALHPDEPWPVPDELLRLVPPRPNSDVLLAAAAMKKPTVERLQQAFDTNATARSRVGERRDGEVTAGSRVRERLGGDEGAGLGVREGRDEGVAAGSRVGEWRDGDVTAGSGVRERGDGDMAARVGVAFDGGVNAALEVAEEGGIVHVRGNEVVFNHPLFALVVYGEVSAPRRRAVHRRLAEVEHDVRVWHRALGTLGPDEQVAQLLEETMPQTAELLSLARVKTPATGPAYTRRVMLLAEALYAEGDLNAARELLDEEIPKLAAGPLRAGALALRGKVAWHQDGGVVAVKFLDEALDDAKADRRLTGEIHALLAIFCETDREEALKHAQAAVLTDPEATALRDHIEVQLGLRSGCAAPAVGVPDEIRQGEAALIEGNLSKAKEYADAAIRTAQHQGQQFADRPKCLRARIDACAGHLDEAKHQAREGADRAEANGDLVTAVGYLHVLAFVAASKADPQAVVDYTARSRRHLATMHIKEPIGPEDPAAERICALAEVGRTAEAEVELAEFERRYARFPRVWMQPVLVRARAAVSGETAGLEVDPSWPRFEQARVLLQRGRLLRRARRPGAAAAAFTEAEALFQDYPVWAAMARDELSRVGRRRATAHLTGTERRVVELVVTGMTNKQVAATLFMSHRTVESHVARTYRKLGIRSRAELIRAMAS